MCSFCVVSLLTEECEPSVENVTLKYVANYTVSEKKQPRYFRL